MMPIQAPLFGATGESKGQFDLPEILFGTAGNRYVLHEVIVGLQRNQRRGTSSTKTRGLVSGGGRKPWKQKGTGNARSGSIRSPLWRGGGIIFGPQPRSYTVRLDEGKRNLALITALYEQHRAGNVSVLESYGNEFSKTSAASKSLSKAAQSRKTLLVTGKADGVVARSLRNIRWLTSVEGAQLNAWGVMQAHKIIFMKDALDVVASRLPKS